MPVEQAPATEIAEAAQTPAPESTPAAPVTQEAAPSEPAKDATPASAYSPNYKFKVADFEHGKTQKEMEFDDFLRPAIKDAETEKKVRELYEKAHGIDAIKQDRGKIQEEFKTVKTQHAELQKSVQELVQLRDTDFDAFIEAAGIKPEKIVEWVQKKLQYQGMTPEQRAELDYNNQMRRRAMSQEKEFTTQQQQYQQQIAQMWEMQVDNGLSRPEVQSVAQAYNERLGKDDAFKDLVYMVGKHGSTSGKDMPVEQAIKQALSMVGAQGHAAPVQGQAGTPPAQRPATIPNVGAGKGSSPVAKTIKSFEDLEQAAKEHLERK